MLTAAGFRRIQTARAAPQERAGAKNACAIMIAFPGGRLADVFRRASGAASHPSAFHKILMDEELRKAADEYHRLPTPGKIAVAATKGLLNQRDLALAYTPGVASVCETIAADPSEARNLTARGNLVAVITNGTAVLGLGAIGPLASKPVMEGKAVLFKKFAGIDVFDIEIAEH